MPLGPLAETVIGIEPFRKDTQETAKEQLPLGRRLREAKTFHQQKDDDALYRDTCFIVVVWNRMCNITEVLLGANATGVQAHLRGTRRGATPLTFKQLPPRSRRPLYRREKEVSGSWIRSQ